MKGNVCPDCGLILEQSMSLQDHRGDELCVFTQTRAKAATDLARAGSTWQTMKKAGVPFTWVPTAWTEHSGGDAPMAEYTRFAPQWAVHVSECTLLNSDERTVILQHCIQHPAAMRAVNAAFRLGGIARQRQPTGKKSAAAKAAADRARQNLRAFFQGVLLTTGP